MDLDTVLENLYYGLEQCRLAHEQYQTLPRDAPLKSIQAAEFFARATRDHLRPLLDVVMELMNADYEARGGTLPG